MPTTECRCLINAQTSLAGPGLRICHHYTNDELDPLIDNLDAAIEQFDVGVNPEFVLQSPLRDQLEAYFRDVWNQARDQSLTNGEIDPGPYDATLLDSRVRLTLTIAFFRHMSIISQLLMAAIVQHLNNTAHLAEPWDDYQPEDDPDTAEAAAEEPAAGQPAEPPQEEPDEAVPETEEPAPPELDPNRPMPNMPVGFENPPPATYVADTLPDEPHTETPPSENR